MTTTSLRHRADSVFAGWKSDPAAVTVVIAVIAVAAALAAMAFGLTVGTAVIGAAVVYIGLAILAHVVDIDDRLQGD